MYHLSARPSSAEIITASEDGMTVVYSDSPLGVIGMIDITNPRAPQAMGNVVIIQGESQKTGQTAHYQILANQWGLLEALARLD